MADCSNGTGAHFSDPGIDDDRASRKRKPTDGPSSEGTMRSFWVSTVLLLAGVAHAESRLAGVMFDGVSAYTPEDLLPLYRDSLGAAFDDKLKTRIAATLCARYENDGFLAPSVEILDSNAHPGVLVFSVHEAAVRRVSVDGRDYAVDPRFWQAVADLQATRPLGEHTFDEWLVRVNHLDGIDVRGALEAVGAGGYEANLHVAPSRLTGLVHVDNRAPESVGYEVMQAQVAYRYSDAHAGQLYAGAAVAADVDRLKSGIVGGSHGVGDGGSALEWSYNRSTSRLPNPYSNGDDDYDRERATAGLRAPLYRDAAVRLDGWSTAQMYDVDERDTTGSLVSRDRIRSVEFGASLSALGSQTRRHDLTFALARGLDAFGAAAIEAPGVAQPDLDYWRYALSYQLLQQFDELWSATLSIEGQTSNDRVPTSERFFIGGRQLGGAFDPASVSGDRGVGARLEVARYVSVPRLSAPLQAYAYGDYGRIESNDSTQPSDDAASVGAGFRVGFGKLSADLEVATPLEDPQSNPLADVGTRVFFSLTQRFN
jgi:hemolysin activation/secretion protein